MNKKRFHEEDDKKLLILVEAFPNDWDKIGKLMNRKKRVCKERYFHYLVPKHSGWQWTNEEKLHLIYMKSILNYQWDEINKVFPSRGPKTIKNQWYYLSKKPSIKILIQQMIDNINQMKNSTEKEIISENNDILEFSDSVDFWYLDTI